MHDPLDFGSEWTSGNISHIEDQVKAWAQDKSQDYNDINRPITREEVKDVTHKLKNNKSSSPENIPNELLKHGGPDLVQSLTSLFNNILTNEVIPEEWKYRQITPLYKGKGKHDDLHNYGGITVNSNIEKTFERVLNNRIIPVLNYTEAQAGGRKGRSTIDQLFILKSVMNQAIKDRRPMYIAFLDISKAYDKAWLDAIMYVLWHSGIRGRISGTSVNI